MSTDDTLPWTTSRCNRLLRPLSSKLAKLRKELERPHIANAEPRNVSSAFAIKGSPQKTTNFTRPAIKPRGFEKARDPDWRPGAKPGAARKTTYGGRGRARPAPRRGTSDAVNQNGYASRPGEIAFTPLISRMGRQLHSSPQVPTSPLRRYTKNRGPLLASIAPPTTNVPRDVHKLVQGSSEAYANLLQATTTGGDRRWKGTRSLMAACLRKLPAYIDLEEHFAELDRLVEEADEEDRDIANELYEQLERHFEQKPGHGWRPFRQVVRAHATTLVCDAITDQVLSLENVLVLVTHCLNASAWDEAEQLLLAYVPLLEYVTLPTNTRADLFDPQKSLYLHAVKDFVSHTGRHRLLYELLEHMVALELLPLEWLATDTMRSVWDRLIRTISENDPRTLASAFQFFETVTLASMGLPDSRVLEDEATGSVSRRFVPSSRVELRQALDTTFSSLLTVLCSIALVKGSPRDCMGNKTAQQVTQVFDTVVIAITTRNNIRDEIGLLNPDTNDVQVMAQRGIWAIFASCLLHLDCPSDPATISFNPHISIETINWLSAQYSTKNINFASIFATLPSLVSSTARGTGRIWKDDGFEQLVRFASALMAPSGCRLPHKLWTLKRLALESAMEFAHNTGDAKHMAYARDIEEKMQKGGRLVIMQSPMKNDSPTSNGGFRWEEGIGEWVTCTPFIKQNAKSGLSMSIPAPALLLTPVQSEEEKDNESHVEDGISGCVPDTTEWEVATFDNADDDGVPQSSPIRKNPRTSTSSLGKRTRAPSPKVVIPVKRMHMTPPDTPPIRYYADLPEEKEYGHRRSSRPRRETKQLTSRQRIQRSRTSLESGLRDIKRPVYAEPAFELDSQSSDKDARTFSSSQDDSEAESPPMKKTRNASTYDEGRSVRGRYSRSGKVPAHIFPSAAPSSVSDTEGDMSDRDELGKTPARLSTCPRLSKSQGRGRPRASHNIAAVNEDEGSEDELSFY
ncbi:hypothetical protein DDE82_002100 [Stemphylium lycopersici]|nr:hypothetical protein TW65_04714 [Stemphylium lycopersici]RAR08811.1 hypothetical protein DDE82_002100 [Stemphylium lycopersici]